MGAAEVIAFEEVRASKPWEALRHQLHERFDPWLDTLATQWPEPPATFPELTAPVWHLRQQRTGGITETRVAHVHRGEHDRPQVHCPRWERVVRAQACVSRTVETLVGPVQRERPSVSCRVCREGLSPLDEVLGLRAGQRQRDVPQAAVDRATAVPYETASTLCGRLTGVPVSRERLPTFTHQVAEGLRGVEVAPSREEMERRVAQVATGRFRRPVVVLGMDGASVPSRPARARGRRPGQARHRARRARWRHEWRAAKGVRFSLLDGERIVHVLRGQQVHNAQARGEALQQGQDAGVIPAEAVRLCVVCDGAAWIWHHVQALCPSACQVRDDYPCAESLHKMAKAQDGQTVQALEWVEAT